MFLMPMLNDNHLEALMEELGPAGDLLAVDAYPAEQLWHLAVDEDTVLFAEPAPDRGVVVLTGDLGKAAQPESGTMYELFLRYAHIWDTNGGLRMSIDGPGGNVWLLMDFAVNGASVADVARHVRSFAASLRLWRHVVSAAPHQGGDTAEIEIILNSATLRA